MKIEYDDRNENDRQFCQWLMRHEQEEPVACIPTAPRGTELTLESRLGCLGALPEYRGWAKLLATPGLRQFVPKVCTHLVAGRHTLPEHLFRHTTPEIAEALRHLPPRPAAAIP